ncbi:hypothetical protein COD37_27870 [Escherichia coli]|nr:hypothetical protein COD37_27870 [Escherichia coli]
MKGIEVETPASLDLTRAAAFAIRLVAVAVLILAVRWWGHAPKTLDTQNTASGGEMGTGSDTGAFFIGGMRQPG